MAIHLVTGTPGAGKTLNTVQQVHEQARTEGRRVYFANIEGMYEKDGLTFENWQKMPNPADEGVDLGKDITPHSWWNAPDGAILFIDECQDYYPRVSANVKQPDYIMRYAKHRHQGFDVYLFTQSPNLINPTPKSWVNPHIHYRRIFYGKTTYRYVNEEIIGNPEKTGTLARAAVKKRIKPNAKYYGTYKSAAVHTDNKRSNPMLRFLLTAPLVVIPLSLWFVRDYFEESKKGAQPAAVAQQVPMGGNGMMRGIGGVGGAMDSEKFDPVIACQPRIEAMPETAPAYDELRKAQDFPRPQCMQNKKRGCRCYSQQGTLLKDYPKDLCRTYVKEGYFDPTRRPRQQEERLVQRQKAEINAQTIAK